MTGKNTSGNRSHVWRREREKGEKMRERIEREEEKRKACRIKG